jgi:SAM-dependent methyltransferase
MIHNNKEVLEYWNDPEVESMYDKNLIQAEISVLCSKIPIGSKILDAGCGEGEGTLQYAQIKDCIVHGVDFSEIRLLKAKERLAQLSNVTLQQVDFLSNYSIDHDFDIIISQRFLINLMEWELQKKVILDLISHLKTGGRLMLFEGSEDGVTQLNHFRSFFGLGPIDIKWHNLFFKDELMNSFLLEHNLKLVEQDGLGDYFLLTRGIRPYFESKLDWNTKYNEIAASKELKDILNLKDKFSRLKLWIIEK